VGGGVSIASEMKAEMALLNWGALHSSVQRKGNDSFSSLSIVAATPLLTLGYLLPFVDKSAAGLGRQRFACVG